MSGIPPAGGPDVHTGERLLAIQWTLASITGIALGLRAYTVVAIQRKTRTSDIVMCLAFVCALVQGIFLTISIKWGLGRHFFYLNDEERLRSMEAATVFQGWCIGSLMLARISICFFMLDLLSQYRAVKYLLWVLISTQVLVNVSTIVYIYAQCGAHIQALWDPSVHATCLNPVIQRNYSFFQSACNSSTDLILTILPSVMLKGLKIRLAKKVAAIFLLSLTGVALVASIFKGYMIKILTQRGDFTWYLAQLHTWALVENYLLIIAASVPMLYHLAQRSKPSPSSTATYGTHVSESIVVQTQIHQSHSQERADVEKKGAAWEEDVAA